MLVVRIYLANIYQICRTNAERTANNTSAPRPYLSGVEVKGNNKAPKDKYGDSRYKKTVDGDRGGIEEAGLFVASRCSSLSSSSLKSNGVFVESSESGNKTKAELESRPAKVGERERPEWNESSLLTDERRLLAEGIATNPA
jgi:hypothetical protein